MTLEKKMSLIFKLDEENWMKHANPWSVWSRNTVLPALVIAFWSRIWLGWWAVLPIILAVIWTYLNPRIFSKPESTDNWASKAVLGERIWSNRDKISIPNHHKKAPRILTNTAGIGALFVIVGVYILDIWPLLVGFSLVYCCKLWFLDRMVWLFEDMKDLEEYGKWLY
ncbi:MAG: DUF6653 family protein [Methanomicrobiales archaeon]